MLKSVLRFATVALLAGTVAGCAGFPGSNIVSNVETTFQNITTSTIAPKAVASAIAAFDGLKITATNYLRLRRCTGSNGPICREPANTASIDAAIRSGTVARNGLKAFLRQHPNQLGPSGLYDSLTAATSTISQATAAYRAANGQ